MKKTTNTTSLSLFLKIYNRLHPKSTPNFLRDIVQKRKKWPTHLGWVVFGRWDVKKCKYDDEYKQWTRTYLGYSLVSTLTTNLEYDNLISHY